MKALLILSGLPRCSLPQISDVVCSLLTSHQQFVSALNGCCQPGNQSRACSCSETFLSQVLPGTSVRRQNFLPVCSHPKGAFLSLSPELHDSPCSLPVFLPPNNVRAALMVVARQTFKDASLSFPFPFLLFFLVLLCGFLSFTFHHNSDMSVISHPAVIWGIIHHPRKYNLYLQ